MAWKCFFVTDFTFLLVFIDSHHRVPPLLVYSVSRLYHTAYLCMKYLLKAKRIFHLSLCVLPPAEPCAPANAVLMQISPGESTYYKQLTFVLIYWIVSATESLKPDPLTSSFLSLLTLTGQAWQVELQQSSLIMWNKSICLEMVGRLQTAGDALILLLWSPVSPPLLRTQAFIKHQSVSARQQHMMCCRTSYCYILPSIFISGQSK